MHIPPKETVQFRVGFERVDFPAAEDSFSDLQRKEPKIGPDIEKNRVFFDEAQQYFQVLFLVATTIQQIARTTAVVGIDIDRCRISKIGKCDAITEIRAQMSSNKIQIEPHALQFRIESGQLLAQIDISRPN